MESVFCIKSSYVKMAQYVWLWHCRIEEKREGRKLRKRKAGTIGRGREREVRGKEESRA